MWIHLQAQHRDEIHARNLRTKMHNLDVGAKSVHENAQFGCTHENAQFGCTHENAQFGYACEILEFHVENEIP